MQGADPPDAAGGYGLTGMRERAELLGGSLTAAPTASGFAVDLWLPA
jgi:signal transduction histidine kinase